MRLRKLEASLDAFGTGKRARVQVDPGVGRLPARAAFERADRRKRRRKDQLHQSFPYARRDDGRAAATLRQEGEWAGQTAVQRTKANARDRCRAVLRSERLPLHPYASGESARVLTRGNVLCRRLCE